jgi:hypothetical protein
MVTMSKLRIGYTSICVLGHRVRNAEVAPDPEKVEAIKGLKAPTTIREVRALLGLMGYYRRFIPNFATLAKPISTLLIKETMFQWGPQ